MGFCRKCGQEVEKNSNFCPKCGEKQVFHNKQEGVSNNDSKNLEYVKCANCGNDFDNSDSYFLSRDALGIFKFKCKNCDFVFKYPVSKNYGAHLVFGIILFFVSFTFPDAPVREDPIGALMAAMFWVIGLGLSIEGIVGMVKNSNLKSKYPDWENRLHNTINRK